MKTLFRHIIVLLVMAVAMLGARTAHADGHGPKAFKVRYRPCCPLAADFPLHLASAHLPVRLGNVLGLESLGHHSYTGRVASRESIGIIYTRRGGFIDVAHTRDYADLTAYLIDVLRPLVARGEGELRLDPGDGEIVLRIKAPAPIREELLDDTSIRLAQRIAFQTSVWIEISQHYGHASIRGAEEYFSSFTPEDIYSNLLGVYLGTAALQSALPYDEAMDVLLIETLRSLEAVPSAETRRVLRALDGRWWHAGTPWPDPSIPIVRSFDIGPHLMPTLPPADVAPLPAAPAALDVPEVDAAGARLSDLYRLEIFPDPRVLRGLEKTPFRVVRGDNLALVVDTVRRDIEAGNLTPRTLRRTFGLEVHSEPLAHYLVGLRLLDLKASGGVASPPSGPPKGLFDGSLVVLRGDTRGGDLSAVRFGVGHTAERGMITSFSVFRSEALYFCRDPDTRARRAPLIGLIGPCSPGEWLGLGGSIGEGFHDGRTGRTAVRPLSLHLVLDALGNGQSASYDGLRLLLRGGGAIEHVWTAAEGGTTIPRAAGSALFLARTPGRHFEATGAVGYRLGMVEPRDAAFESSLGLRWYVLLGGKRSAKSTDGIDPWGVGALGLEGAYSYWTRPAHSYADLTPPFASAVETGTWQLLATVTLGFSGLTY